VNNTASVRKVRERVLDESKKNQMSYLLWEKLSFKCHGRPVHSRPAKGSV